MRLNKLSPSFRTDEDDPRYKQVDADLQNLFLITQSRVRFGDGTDGTNGENIAGQFQDYTSSGSIGTELSLAHTIGSVPVGVIILAQDLAGHLLGLPAGGGGATAWTSTEVFFTSDASSVTFKVFLIK